jgi:hypothetical protein
MLLLEKKMPSHIWVESHGIIWKRNGWNRVEANGMVEITSI